MATAKQLAARKLFAARAKAGTLRKGTRKKNPAKALSQVQINTLRKRLKDIERAMSESPEMFPGAMKGFKAERTRILKKLGEYQKNPIARTNISKTAYVKRPSQATGKAPTKRLTARRKTVASGKAPKGYFPNPSEPHFMKRHNYYAVPKYGDGATGGADEKDVAVLIAQAFADFYQTQYVVLTRAQAMKYRG